MLLPASFPPPAENRKARRVSRLVAAAATAGLLAAPASSAVVFAHDVVLKATPPDGGTVAEFPRTIVLEFSGIPKSNYNTVAVSDAESHEVLFTAEPELENQVVTVQVPDSVHPGPGEYLVGFQITSSDGHATRGKTTFTVADDAPEPQEETATSEPATEAGPSLGAIVGIAAIVAVIAAVLFTFVKRKKG